MTQEEQEHSERQRQLAADFKATFTKFESGKRVYAELEKICLKRSQTFNPMNPEMSIFNAGAREVILRIDDYINMVDKKPRQTKAIN